MDALLAGVLDTPAAPEISFNDDPLRMLRAARFVSQLGFTLAPRVHEAIVEMSGQIERITAERVRTELDKLILGEFPIDGVNVMCETGLAARVIPEIPQLKLEIDEHHQHKDVYWHSLTVLKQAIDLEDGDPDLVLRWAALLHDIGKPDTKRNEPGGGVSFHHHEVVGAKMVRKRMRALKYSKQMVDEVGQLVFLHLRFHGYGEGQWTDSAVRRYVTDAGDLLPRLHKLVRADCTTATSGARRSCRPRMTTWSDGLRGSPSRRIWRGCVRTSTATRSWSCSASRPVRRWARRGSSSRSCVWTAVPSSATRPRPNC